MRRIGWRIIFRSSRPRVERSEASGGEREMEASSRERAREASRRARDSNLDLCWHIHVLYDYTHRSHSIALEYDC